MKYHQDISVGFSYDVVFTRSVFALENEALANALPEKRSRAVFFVDDGLLARWPELIQDIQRWCGKHSERIKLICEPVKVPGGEKIKNDMTILDTVGELAVRYGLDRHEHVVIVGGGAVLDAVGFAAATIHRGLRQIRIPTTVLSQDDSGVGVKNGLNRFGIKNYYGAFAPPEAVIVDTEFLSTLDQRDWLSGIAEAFKVAVIKDASFLDYLNENGPKLAGRDRDAIEYVVRRAAELHLAHIGASKDAFERQAGRPLDFGHWVGHWLEDMTNYELRHGEAVAVGMAVDLYCAAETGLIDKDAMEYVISAMERCGLVLWHDKLDVRGDDGKLRVLTGLEQFRQHLGGQLTLAMPDGLGQMKFVNELAESIVEDAVSFLRDRS
jgi:3-dehydroquinate synthase